MAWTTDDLLTSIKNNEMFPDASSGSLSSSALLQYATTQLYIKILPMILGVREKYYETYLDTTYTSSTTAITIPSRASGGVLSCVQFYYGNFIRALEPIDPSQVLINQTTAYPTNFYYQNNSIIPYPGPTGTSGSTLRMRYFQRPNRLALTSDCAQITAFDSLTKVVTCVVPTTWTTSNTFDFIPKTASQATPYGLDSSITGITSTSITFSTLPSAVAIGDWIALSEYTPIPEIPFEFQGVLAQAACCKALEAINDQIGLAAAEKTLGEYMSAAVKLLTPRDQLGHKIVVSGWRNF